MAVERIESLISEKALAEFDTLNAKLAISITAFEKLVASGVQVNSSLGKNQNVKATLDNLKEMNETEKLLAKQSKDLEIAQAKLNATFTERANELAKAKVVQAEVNKQMREEAKAALGLTDAYDRLTTEYNAAAKEAKRLAVEQGIGSKAAQEASARALDLDAKLKAADASVGRFNKNVGNYSGAINILKSSFDEVGKKIDAFKNSGQQNVQVLKALEKEYELLNRLVNTQEAGFANATMEIRANQRALLDLENAGLKSSEQYRTLAQATGELKDQVGDLQTRTKNLGSDTFVFDGLIGAAQGLAGVYGIAQGASALFGEENEELAKTFVKLQAIMTVIQSLQAVSAAIQKENSAALLISNIRTQASVALQRLLALTTLQSAAATAALRIAIVGLTGGLLLLLPLAAFAFEKLGNAQAKRRREQELSNEVTKKAIEGYAEEKTKLSLLVQEAQNEETSKKRKLEIIKELQETYPNYFSNIKNEGDLTDKLTEAYTKANRALLVKAQIQAAQEIIAEKTKEILKAETGALEDQLTLFDKVKIAALSGFAGTNTANAALLGVTTATKNIKNFKDSAQKDIDILIKKLFSLNGELSELGGDPLEKDKNKDKKKSSNASFFDKELKDQADFFKKLSEAESLYLTTRLDARKKSAELEKQILEGQRRVDILNAEGDKKKLFDIEQNFNFEKRKVEENLQSDLLKIRASAMLKSIEQDKEINDRFQEEAKAAREKELADLGAENQIRLEKIATARDEELRQQEIAYQDKLAAAGTNEEKIAKVQEEYAVKRAETELIYAKQALQEQLRYTEAYLALAKARGEDTTAIEAKIANLKMQLSELETKQYIANNEKKRKSDKERLEEFQKELEVVNRVYGQVTSLIGDFIQQRVDREKNAIQETIDANSVKAQQEIEAVNASALTEEEKANRIQIINARTQAQKEQLERRQRQLDLQRARYEKAFGIGQIIINTAMAVTKQLTSGDPYTAIARAFAVGALGAAQLALAIAQPLPKFATGTDDAPGGLAVVGDGGKRELVVTPDGQLIATPDVPTVMNVPKHSIILPDLRKVLEAGIHPRWGGSVINNNEFDSDALISEIRNLNRTVKNKVETHIHPGRNGWEMMTNRGGTWTNYLNKNL